MNIKVIRDDEEFAVIKERASSEHTIAIPVFADANRHPADNPLSLLAIYFKPEDELIILPIAHYDSPYKAPIDELKLGTTYALDATELMHAIGTEHGPILDLSALAYIANKSVPTLKAPWSLKSPYANAISPLYKWADLIAEIIPDCNLISHLMINGDMVSQGEALSFLMSPAIPGLAEVEAAGLHIDRDKFLDKWPKKEHLISKDDRVFGSYNLFTAAGRPSCKFGGINFAALNKTDGSRECFTSRFDNGSMVLIDYEAFHVYLIADLIGYDLTNKSPHKWFGEMFYGLKMDCEDDYAESKKRTFHYLYSDTPTDIPFFRKVNEYKTSLWNEIEQNGFITSPKGRRIYKDRIYEPSVSKLFNYMIQLYETEHNLTVLRNIQQTVLREVKTKIVLYNYDAFLLDYCEDDGWEVIERVAEGMGGFPVRVYKGSNYHNVRQI